MKNFNKIFQFLILLCSTLYISLVCADNGLLGRFPASPWWRCWRRPCSGSLVAPWWWGWWSRPSLAPWMIRVKTHLLLGRVDGATSVLGGRHSAMTAAFFFLFPFQKKRKKCCSCWGGSCRGQSDLARVEAMTSISSVDDMLQCRHLK